MNLQQAREHAKHLCDVWPTDRNDDHIGVITRMSDSAALVAGHPDYPARWFDVSAIETNCRVK